MSQRDFFKADVLPFPLDRTVEVERMARFLHVVHGERAEASARRCKDLAKRLLAAGLTPEEVQQRILAFHDVVQLRLQAFGQRRAGSGA